MFGRQPRTGGRGGGGAQRGRLWYVPPLPGVRLPVGANASLSPSPVTLTARGVPGRVSISCFCLKAISAAYICTWTCS